MQRVELSLEELGTALDALDCTVNHHSFSQLEKEAQDSVYKKLDTAYKAEEKIESEMSRGHVEKWKSV